jgi:hypothetical protein
MGEQGIAIVDRLLRDHDRVRATADAIDQFLDEDSVPVDPAFARLRWTLARELATHLAAERTTYPAVKAQARGDAIYRGIDHALDADLAAHAAEWTIARIEADWSAYRRNVRLLLRRLRRRMAYEETVLFPLLPQG